jgi:long-chain acyl-CoA synthetase
MKTKFRTLREIVDYSVNKYCEKIAFRIKQKVEKGVKATYKDISYGKMGEDIKALASYFNHKGLCGKRIVVVGDNCYEWILGYLSVVCSGNVFVPLDKNLPSHELEGLLVRSEAECIIYGPQFEDLVQKFAQNAELICMNGGLAEKVSIGKKLVADGDTSYENVVIDENAMSILLFTSGTTSASKAVMLSQYNIACNINDLIEAEKFYDDDVYLALLPYHHVFGLVGMTLFISLGIKTVFCEGLRVAKALKEYKVSVLVLVPLVIESMYRQIERTVKKQGKEKVLKIGIMLSRFLLKFNIDIRRKLFDVIHSELGGKLRFIISGGAALKPELSCWFNDIGILTVQGYGLSETSPVVSAESHLYMESGSIGKRWEV